MDIVNKISHILQESIFPIYGKEKSPDYLRLRKNLLTTKNPTVLKSVMNDMVVSYKKNNFWDHTEFLDLIYKLDDKIEKMGLRGKVQIPNIITKSLGIEKFPNKVRMK